VKIAGLCLDDENWAFPDNYFDLIINNLQLHWVNNVHETAEKWLNSLKPDGSLLGVALGGDTLQELRICLSLAEQEREGGVSTHVSPMLNITDVGQVLIRLNYKLITANADLNTFYFDDSFALMNFLQRVGEGNSTFSRRMMLAKDTFIATDAIYRGLFMEKAGEFIGKIPATFELVHFIGWKEHPDQRKPLARGTRGIDIKTLAEEVDDSDMEQIEIKEVDDQVKVKNIPKNPKNK
jgi:NADH dehydrogenase [ubiquinone] 1 alpha subcomplex assembly factor 5